MIDKFAQHEYNASIMPRVESASEGAGQIPQESFNDYVNEISPQDLYDELKDIRRNLATHYGVRMPASGIIDDAMRNGVEYEDVRYRSGDSIPTPFNCLMAVLDSQPELRKLDKEKFSNLVGDVAKLAMASRAFISRTGAMPFVD